MKVYLELLKDVLETGNNKEDRTGTGTISKFGMQKRYDLRKGFPAMTTKRLAWKAVVSELLWFLEGSTDERRLAEILYEDTRENLISKRTIWTDNADTQGKDLGYENTDLVKELGPVYGKQWRSFGVEDSNIEYDQIYQVIHLLKNNPDSRRIVLSSWNPLEISNMALPPCHVLVQFYVCDGELSAQMYQRSADLFLGVPFNIASYALLIHILAQICNLKVGEFIHNIGDAHIYTNHLEQVNEQLFRTPDDLPTLQNAWEFSNLEGSCYSVKPLILFLIIISTRPQSKAPTNGHLNQRILRRVPFYCLKFVV